jgi:CRP-like cAMP-binding protein
VDAQPEDDQPVAALLARNRLLGGLRSDDRQRLSAIGLRVIVEKQGVLFHEGDAATDVWLIVSGMVKLVRLARLEVILALELKLPHELIGAVFYRDHPLRPCSAIAMEHTELIQFPAALLDELLEQNPAVTRAFLADVCRDLCHAQQMRGLARDDVPRRVGRALLYLHARFGSEISQGRGILAELAGTTVESAIRVTRNLSERGIVRTARGRITIQSLPRLQAFTRKTLGPGSAT